MCRSINEQEALFIHLSHGKDMGKWVPHELNEKVEHIKPICEIPLTRNKKKLFHY